MNCKILAICDSQSIYAELLTKQLLRIPGNRLEIRNFTEINKLIAFAKEKTITYVVIAQEYKKYRDDIESLSCYYLTDQKLCESTCEEEEYIFRYQKVEAIYEAICGIKIGNKDAKVKEKRKFQVIGVFNPVHRNGQTTFSRLYAKHSGRQGAKVLYLNLEEFPAAIQRIRDEKLIQEGQGNLADLIYHMKQNSSKIVGEMEQLLHKGRDFDCIEPIGVNVELKNISLIQWEELIALFERYGYDTVVVDINSCVQGYIELLSQCEKIYVPITNNNGDEEKMERFVQSMKILGKKKLLIKMEHIELGDSVEEAEDKIVKEVQASG